MVDKKYPRSKQKDLDYALRNGEAYASWEDEEGRDQALSNYSATITEFAAASRTSYDNITKYQSGRPGLQKSDYDYFRSSEKVPTKSKEIISFARKSYRQIGLIRNSIDLMGDFACQGVRLVHPNPRIERFYNDWFSRIKGTFVSERFCNLLFREANVVIRMKTAKLNKSKRLEMQRAVADIDMKADLKENLFRKGELPWQYTFLDPLLLEVVGGPLASMSGQYSYRMDIPKDLKRDLNKIRNSGSSSEKDMLKNIPKEFLDTKNGAKGIILPEDKTFTYFYKKDDWQLWADPMTYACFDDLILYEKLKLADKAALDGAVNKIRVWKLGSLDHKLAPTPTAASALGNILGANTGGGTMDIVWGPDIELLETGTDVQRFLGEEKYRPTLMSIYSCLGIPPTLTGTFGASGTTNNFISLKTLTERLNYVRSILVQFWSYQVKAIQKSMGFRQAPQVEFDYMQLDDPASMMQLMVNLADRNIISDEFIQRQIKAKPNIEEKRISNESKKRDKGSMQEKVSPYHSVDKDFSKQKIALQTGVASPSQVGLKLDPKSPEEKSALEMRSGPKQETIKVEEPSSPGSPGRPKNSNDQAPRQPRGFRPALKARTELWAKKAQAKISKIVNPIILDRFEKKNMRSLSSDEIADSEKVKFEILCSLEPNSNVDERSVAAAIKSGLENPSIHNECGKWISEASECSDQRLAIDEIRSIRASYYTYLSEKNGLLV
tara:strand:+ start:6760 stop:8925 length:2166 start_codon:yes stop_codon:yes gene_type:complete